jgi:ABC-2 type transport system permease protein
VSELTATPALVRFVLRRDRVHIAVWILAVGGLVLTTVASVKGIYPTQASLDRAALAIEGNAAVIALNGPPIGLHTLGGRVVFESGSFGLVVVALMSVLMIGRHTRAEEERGRTELMRAVVVGRFAPPAAALIVVAAMNVAVGVVVTLGLIAQDLPVTGSLVFGASFTALGFVFAGIALVAAQVTENTRVVYGTGGALLGLAFVLRAIGDSGDGTLSWLSPIGWVQASRAYAGERWWPLALALVAAVVLVAAARALAARRDLGAGLVAPRPGPPAASRRLAGPIGLAFRLQRGSLAGWTAGLFLGGLAYGSLGDAIEDLVRDNEALADLLTSGGGASLTDAFFGSALLMLALIGCGYAIGSAQRLRVEETTQLVEPLLAAAVSRRRWAASHLIVALTGSVVVLGAAGLGAGAAFAIVSGDASQVPRLLSAALVHVPAVWVLVGLAAALFGLAPRAESATWAALGLCLVIGPLGNVLSLPGWLTAVSPFEHTPQLPAADLAVAPLAILLAIAAGLMTMGLAAFRHRDLAC